MKSVINFWKKKKLWLTFLIVFTFINTIITLLFPYILKDIIDGIKANFARHDLIKYVLILGILGFFRALFNTLLPLCRGKTNESFLIQKRTGIFSKILKKGYSFTNFLPAGDILQRLDHDLRELSWFACSGIFRPIEGIIIILVTLFFLIKINLLLTIFAVLPMSLAIFACLKISPLMYKYYYKWRDAMAKVNNYLHSSFSGIKLVKSYTMEKKSHHQFNKILQTRIEAAIKVIKIEAIIDTLFSSIQEVGIIFILLFGGIFIIKGNLTIGEFIAFNAYILLLLGPMIRIGHFFVSKKRAQVQSERLEQIENYPLDVVDNGKKQCIAPDQIVMNNVSFKYSKESPVILKKINIKIPAGKRIGLAGTVGSGKTTLTKLLMRIVDPIHGKVKINKFNIKEIPLSQLRSLVGYVPQEPSLFSDTIRNNIIFGRDCSSERLNEAIKLAQLEDFMKNQAKGLDEVIGEKGLKLSGGEKQRMGIARAILDHPKILILDDATSNLDAETEKKLINQLSKSLDTTIIIISHRLSILSICDYIYVLDQGEIVEQGTHNSLLKKKELYWRLYQHQIIEEKLK
ncbi:ABC transporter ATP-binding protein [candidate division WOR-3 bacterium]|nr:ABC transporter ATP-binding protein [candidate division WOR-3 bacterium]